MFTDRIKKYISPMDAGLGGPARDGMRLHMSHVWWDFSKKSYFIVGLYIHDAVFENSVDSLEKMFTDFESSPWYPVGTGHTLEEAFASLDKKLELADTYQPAQGKDDWRGMVFTTAFQFTACEERDARYEFDGSVVYNPLP